MIPSGTRGRGREQRRRRDLRQRGRVLARRSVGRPGRVLLGALSLVVLVLARSFISPPSAWDDLTYHVYKAGSWVHAGHLVSQHRPDAWTFYDYYPASGEVIWSWLLLAGRSGTYLGLGSVFIWSSCLLAGVHERAAAGLRPRAVRCSRRGAITFIPAVAVFADTSHVDNVMLLGFLIGFVFLLEARRQFGWWAAFAGLTGFALTAGVKLTAILLLGLGVVWVGVYAFTRAAAAAARRSWRGRRHARRRARSSRRSCPRPGTCGRSSTTTTRSTPPSVSRPGVQARPATRSGSTSCAAASSGSRRSR